MSNHKRTIMLLAVVVAAATLAFAQQQSKTEGESLDALLKQREQALQALVEVAKIHYEQGRATLVSLIAAQRELLDAQLDMAATREDRLEIRESQLRLATDQENYVARLIEIGDVPQADLLTAKVGRLNAQIDLLREKQSE